MEYFDVYNKNRIPLNYKKVRGEELLENEFNTGVEVWITNDNKILMTKRSLLKSHPGQWETPGGCIQAGESSLLTAQREMAEEIGINFKEDDFRLIGTQLYKHQFVDIYNSNKNIDINDISLQIEEVSDVKFVSKEEFIKMIDDENIVPSVLQRYYLIKDKLDLNW